MLRERKTDEKFRFVEDFPDYREQESEKRIAAIAKGETYEPEYPTIVKTKFFGTKQLHQIARVEWRESTVTVVKERLNEKGLVEEYEETVKFYEEVMGEKGGWLESMDNLSQQGKSWVETDGYVVEGAYVGGDAVVKGGAEIGGEAKVRGQAVIDGPVGIGGLAEILDKAQVNGEQRMAVFGNAVVSGAGVVTDSAKVYGNAKLSTVGGEHWNPEFYGYRFGGISYSPPFSALVKDRVRLFGDAIVSGTIADDAMVYGNAEVRGYVGEQAEVGGDAFVYSVGKVSGNVILLTGTVRGALDGEGIIAFPEFYLGDGSVYKLGIEDKMRDAYNKQLEWRNGKTDKEKDKTEERDKVSYVGEIISLNIENGSSVSGCEFKGSVRINYTIVKGSKVSDSIIGPRGNLGWEGGFVVESEIENSQVFEARIRKCKLKYVVSARTVPFSADESDLDHCSILSACLYMGKCNLKETTIDTHYIESETIEHGYVCDNPNNPIVNENWKHSDLIPIWKKWRVLFSDRKPDKDDIPYFENLKDFYVFVYEFATEEDRKEAEREYQKVINTIGIDAREWEFRSFWGKAMARRAWIDTYLTWANNYRTKYEMTEDESSSDADDSTESDAEGKENEERVYFAKMQVVFLLGLYLQSISELPLARMSDASFQKVKESVEKTLESFNENRFTPYYDFGEIKEDEDLLELEKKYNVIFNPTYGGSHYNYTMYKSWLSDPIVIT